MKIRISSDRGRIVGCILTFVMYCVSLPAMAQVLSGDPKPDVNIVGPTKDPNDIRDEGLKQQNEPACRIRPGDSDCIICFFNDYRTVDVLGHEDAWIGQAESCDAANTWTSRTVPGHPNHPAPINAKFAADPRVVAIPGLAIHGFIGGFRDADIGVIAVQHWLENNKSDFNYYEPALETIIVDEGTEGRFIDKPEFLGVMSDQSPQPTVTISSQMENSALGTISRTYPAGILYAAYAVFTGSSSVKLLVKKSNTWGDTWPNKTVKLTESQNLVSGISMTAKGNIVMAMWRQVLDINDSDAMFYAYTLNEGRSWTKPIELTQICKFDQPSLTLANPPQVTMRTNDFPWLANDGKNIYAFYTERVGSCATGTPKLFMQHTADGESWSAPQQIDNSVAAAVGAQFMPAAFGALGKVQVAWYDTRREGVPVDSQQPFVADFIPSSGIRVNRKIDVYTARVVSDEIGGNVQVSESSRVSRYREVADVSNPSGPKYEIEASFGNAMMYSSGLLAFLGDYMSVGGQEFRPDGNDGWESNQPALPPPASNLTDFFIAYADHRDVRGDVLFGDGGNTKPFTPADNVPAATAGRIQRLKPLNFEEEPTMLAGAGDIVEGKNEERQSAEGIEDFFTDPSTACVPDQDRTRNANIYGSMIRDTLRLSTPDNSKPLSGILRAFPTSVRNTSSQTKNYRLYIANQPGADPLLHRASFRQKPDRGPFVGAPPPVLTENTTIQPYSSTARTVFVVSPNLTATVDVVVYDVDDACVVAADAVSPLEFASACNSLASITLGGAGTAGNLQQPDYLSSSCAGDPACADVTVTELHNPLLENPLLENPLLENPLLENPLLENMELEAPLLENPLLENPLLENFGFENPLLENPLLENPLLENPLLENPLLENPLLENPLLENSALAEGVTYTDVTAVVRNDGNVTTSYNFDATVANFTGTAGGEPVSQLILWKQYAYGTSRGCEYRPEVRNQVVATINQPNNTLSIASIEEPFNGEASMILAPGERAYVTYRFFGTMADLANVRVNQLTASSQAANCDEFDDVFGPPPGQEDDFYFCQDQIASNRELIILQIDTTGPVFDGLTEGQVIPVPAVEANAPGGACLDPIATGIVSATDDEGGAVTIGCVNAEGDEICLTTGDTGLSLPVSNLVVNPGPSPMTCTAADEAGNETVVNVLFEVLDTLAPFFTSFPSNPTIVNADPVTGTAAVDLAAGLAAEDVDGVDPDPVIACSADTTGDPSDPVPTGINNVTCRVTDVSGNFSELSYVLQVNDVTFPVVTVTGDNPQIVEAGYPYIEQGATATDNVGVSGGVVTDASAVNTMATGTYIVTYTATDGAGNTTIATRNVNVIDTTPPDFTEFPIDIVISANADGTATVDFSTPGATDNAGVPTISCVPPSGTIFAVGTTSVTCTATDGSGNSSAVTFDVIVQDTTPPIIVLSGENPLTLEVGSDYVEPGFAASDNVGVIGGVSVTGNIDNTVAATYTLTYTAADAAGNITSVARSVDVVDTTAPILAGVSGDITVEAAAAPGNVVTYPAPTATDLSFAGATVECAPASGSTFAIGVTTVSCTATDGSGNASSQTFTITVQDTTSPVITVTGDNPLTLEAGEMYVELGATATDDVGVDGGVSASGIVDSTTPGSYTISYSASDAAGNSASAERSVIVVDTVAPTLQNVPGNVTAEAGAALGNAINYTPPTAFDISAGGATVDCQPPSGSIFPIGTSTVTCSANDSSGNLSQQSFTVTVQDTTAPIVVLNGASSLNIEVGTEYNEQGAAISDAVGVVGGLTISGAVDSTTPGTYIVTYGAVDAADNATSVSRSVIYVDSTSPTLQGVPADITAEAASATGNNVAYTAPSATDNSSGGADVVCSPVSGALFPLGTTMVTCTATDGSGNSSDATFNIIVRDTIAPLVNVPANVVFEQIQGPAGSIVDYSGLAAASDNIDPAPTLSCTPASGGIFAPGDTSVSCTARDNSGNETTESFVVSVGYSNSFGIDPNKNSMKTGSSNTLSWGWQDEFGNSVDSSADVQLLSIVDCDDTSIIILEVAGDPGSSGFRLKVNLSWEFNFQADDDSGTPLPNGKYCASVTSGLTGQMMESPPIRVR